MSAQTVKLSNAQDRLKHTFLKNGILCRDEQQERIYNFLYQRLFKKSQQKSQLITNHDSKFLFICGVPGTGKTATVQVVIDKFEILAKEKSDNIHPFRRVYINAEQLATSKNLYKEVYYRLTKIQAAPSKARDELDALFQKSSRDKVNNSSYVIIVLDELDCLYSRGSEPVFYDLFEWTNLSNSKVIVIAIANAIDLSEKLKTIDRLRSRVGWETLVFGPYNQEALRSILKSRLDDGLLEDCFDDAAIKILTIRAGRSAGDARKVLDCARAAIEMALEKKSTKVTPSFIEKVWNQDMSINKKLYLTDANIVLKMILKSILEDLDSLGISHIHSVKRRLDTKMFQRDKPPTGICTLMTNFKDLEKIGIIQIEKAPLKSLFSLKVYIHFNADPLIKFIRDITIGL